MIDGKNQVSGNTLLENAVQERLCGPKASTSGQPNDAAQSKGNDKHTYHTAGTKGNIQLLNNRRQAPFAINHSSDGCAHSAQCHAGAPQHDEGHILSTEINRGHKRIYRRLDRHGEGWDGFDVTDDKVHACVPSNAAKTNDSLLQKYNNAMQSDTTNTNSNTPSFHSQKASKQ